MGGETAPCWRIALEAPAKALAAVEAALQELGGALVSDAAAGRERILVQLYLTQAPDAARLTALLAAAELAAGTGLPAPRVERLAAADWVAEGERALPGLEIGPFYVHGRHVSAPPPAGAVPMLIEASLAFGSGRHASTQGCLRAFGRLHRARGVERALDMGCGVERALDMGCGSGILAIAAAKLWGCPVLAVDVDPKALVKARENARANGVARLVTVARGRGFDCPALAPGARFGLIVENILAEPIHAMAPALLRHLAPGGVAVLSGLLAEEAATVAAAHAPLRLVERIELDGWVTLVLRA